LTRIKRAEAPAVSRGRRRKAAGIARRQARCAIFGYVGGTRRMAMRALLRRENSRCESCHSDRFRMFAAAGNRNGDDEATARLPATNQRMKLK